MYVLLTAWTTKQALYSCLLRKALIIEVIFIAFWRKWENEYFLDYKENTNFVDKHEANKRELKQEFYLLTCHRSWCFISNQASLAKDEKYLWSGTFYCFRNVSHSHTDGYNRSHIDVDNDREDRRPISSVNWWSTGLLCGRSSVQISAGPTLRVFK